MNHGTRPTVHVAQLYADVGAGGDRELVGVLRVPLASRESGGLRAVVGPDAFARWDGSARVPVDGRHLLHLATSSADPGTVLEVTVAGGAVVGAVLRR